MTRRHGNADLWPVLPVGAGTAARRAAAAQTPTVGMASFSARTPQGQDGARRRAPTVRTGRRPRNALRCRPQIPVAEPVIAPSSEQQTRLSHPVPSSRPGYRTQFRTTDPAIAPSSEQPSRLSHPVPISRPGYRTQFRAADPVIAPSSEQPTRLSHPVPNSRAGYRTQFRSADVGDGRRVAVGRHQLLRSGKGGWRGREGGRGDHSCAGGRAHEVDVGRDSGGEQDA